MQDNENMENEVSNEGNVQTEVSEASNEENTRTEVKSEAVSETSNEGNPESSNRSNETGERSNYNNRENSGEGGERRRYDNRRNPRQQGSMGGRRPRNTQRRTGTYSRRKVSRLYKILGSDKKIWDEKIDYKNVELLRNFITDAGKISPRRTTGVSPIYHRKIVREIKKARMIALLPFKAGE